MNNLRMLLSEKFTENQVQIELALQGPLQFEADETLMSHVLINILNNAVDALSEKKDNRKIRIKTEQNTACQLSISVMNNGPMIPQDLMDKIFIPFFTTKDSGTGIGLSLSRQILHLHGGYIDVRSDEELTVFQIII